ncbi:MAG: alpha/beta hydrolase [Clostridia bacterium]|nr:alpha/beta hydrolase [Clostridia bacterium]
MIYKKISLDSENEKIFLECYIAEKIPHFTRKAILVIPGGGYGSVCDNREGEPIAHAFMARGYNAFVLHYSVISNSTGKVFPAQLIEASKSIKYIKDNAEEFGHDPNKVFVTGFSAGGHLCASTGILWNLPEIYEAIDMPYGYNKPAGIMPVYPVINNHTGSFRNLLGKTELTDEDIAKVSLDIHVNAESSPAFIVHTVNDQVVPVANALDLAKAYAEAGVPFELHIYPDSPHGFALGNNITMLDVPKWNDASIGKWIENAVYWTDKISE